MMWWRVKEERESNRLITKCPSLNQKQGRSDDLLRCWSASSSPHALFFFLGGSRALALSFPARPRPRAISFPRQSLEVGINGGGGEAVVAVVRGGALGLHFLIQNLPFGVIWRRGSPETRPCLAVAIGDFALDLAAVSDAGLFDGPVLSDSPCFRQETLNMFLGMGRPAWKEARATLQRILSADEPVLSDNEASRKKCLVPMSDVEMLLPITAGDYTDFFCSVHHARNCGFIFRGPQTPVNPN